MPRLARATALAAAPFLLCAASGDALAHGFAGKRFFPATLATDDPFVADELSLPTVSTIRRPPSGDEPAAQETEFSVELAKRITPNFGLSIEDGFRIVAPKDGPTETGFGNIEIGGKYQFLNDAAHEAILSAGLSFEVGGTGAQRVDADRFNTVTPAVFFGKGFGDLPDSLPWLKPFAVTGTLGYAIPLRSSSNKFSTDEDTGATVLEVERHPDSLQYGFALEYSLPYLQSSVRDVGLGSFFGRLIPLVEFSFQSPLDRNGGGLTATVNPGIVWAGQVCQVGIEAIVPINERTGRDVGVLAQLHFYLDDLLPGSLGRPLFGGNP
jgi:hypothetical protein